MDMKTRRRLEIFEAAYRMLAEKGYKGTTMLGVAKAAGASNETMYNWFGNKQGLLAEMISENAKAVGEQLGSMFADDHPSYPIERLTQFGEMLLILLTGEKSVALNRAAAADASEGAVLGALLAENGRKKIVPQLAEVFKDAQKRRILGTAHDCDEIAEVYVALLLGDVQIRRAIGVTQAPGRENTRTHSQRVSELILQLFGA